MKLNQRFFLFFIAKLYGSFRSLGVVFKPLKDGEKMCCAQKTEKQNQLNFGCVKVCNIFLLVALPLNLSAETSTKQGHRSAASHQHGLAELRISIEGGQAEIEFKSPAFNLVGFEHEASSPQEKKAVKDVIAFLETPAELISLKGSTCSLKTVQIDASSVINQEDERQNDDEHDHEAKHDHKAKHDHDAEDDHEAKHDHEAEHDHHDQASHERDIETRHADIVARYRLSCDNFKDLRNIETNFFDVFSGLETIKALWVSETSQGTVRLTPSNRRLDLN